MDTSENHKCIVMINCLVHTPGFMITFLLLAPKLIIIR